MAQKINLKEFRGGGSRLFTGRPQGRQARKKLGLDKEDIDNSKNVTFIIPLETTSFNPSFYLGLLFESYKNIGVDGFNHKYSFEIEETDPSIRKVLEKNLADGARNAINEITKKTGILKFLKK